MDNKTTRRASFKKLGMGLAALFGVGSVNAMSKKMGSDDAPAKKEVVGEIVTDQDIPLFSGAVRHGNTLYIAGKGAHTEPYEIKAHTEIVLQELEKGLKANGSSMDQVLKVNVYLADLGDYQAMNEVFRGRFGKNPPVRTTVATYGGVPGKSLVEMDCIAAVE
ncbi:enamine deaminase RidA (YjgF/YER057c/UK114 family) [Flavobacteriaceae bacterium MAR_2009_75]|nr:enamine deaminase RidA (YjgF/YER057c/UK114 family) [Flavobacteriaceae bacterium MAR_2009_75]